MLHLILQISVLWIHSEHCPLVLEWQYLNKKLGLKIPIQNIINDKCYILCSKCPPTAATHAWSLFCRSPTLQLLYQLCAGQACPIPQQSGGVARRHPYCLSCKPRSCSMPQIVVHWFEIGAVGWPQIWWNHGCIYIYSSGGIKSGVNIRHS